MTQQPSSTDRPYAGQPGAAAGTTTEMPETRRHSRSQYEGAQSETGTFAEREMRDRALIASMGSRLRIGPVFAGFVIGLATWIMLELALFALDLGALAAQVVPSADNSSWWWSAGAAVIAFFLGGLVAGATTPSRTISDGILHGITLWALTVVALVISSAAGVGIGFGAVGDVLASSSTLVDADATVVNDAQTAAAVALLALAVTLVAAAVGGAIAAKMWPRRREIDLRRSTL